METLAECPICMIEYVIGSTPSTLQCGHTLCMNCVQEIYKKYKKIICPFDKSEYVMDSVKPNYEMVHLIEKYKVNCESYSRERQELEEEMQLIKTKIEETQIQKEELKKDLQEKHSADLVQKVKSAVIETEEKGKNRMRKKLKEQEQKFNTKIEKISQQIKEIEEKKRKEEMQIILMQCEEQLNRQKKLVDDQQSKFENEKKRLEEAHKKKEAKMQEDLKKKLEEEKKKHEQELKQKLQQELLEERLKIEREAQQKLDEKMAKLKEEELALERQKRETEMKERERIKEHQKKLEQIERENKEKQEYEQNLKRMADEQLAKAQKKVQDKMRTGKLFGIQPERVPRENMQRDNNRLYWAFRTPKGNYLEYFENLSTLIEKAFIQDREYVYLKNRGNVDFYKWREVKDTGEEVMIKRVNSFQGSAIWSYRMESGWLRFSDQDIFEIEKAWLSMQPNCMVMNGNYLDFNSLTVSISGVQRPVLRDILRREI